MRSPPRHHRSAAYAARRGWCGCRNGTNRRGLGKWRRARGLRRPPPHDGNLARGVRQGEHRAVADPALTIFFGEFFPVLELLLVRAVDGRLLAGVDGGDDAAVAAPLPAVLVP